MNKYSVWMEIPEEDADSLTQDYIDESGLNLTVQALRSQAKIVGIRKRMKYKVENVEDPEDVQMVDTNVVVGVVGLIVNQPDKGSKLASIVFHYIIPKYRGDFENFYKFIVNQLRQDGYTHLAWTADSKTSRFIQRNADNKAKVHQHYGRVEEFLLKEKEKQEGVKKVKDQQFIGNEKETPKPDLKAVEEEVQEKDISQASTGQYPGEVRH